MKESRLSFAAGFRRTSMRYWKNLPMILLALSSLGCVHRPVKMPLDQLPSVEIPKECITDKVTLLGCTHLSDVDETGRPLPPQCKGSKLTFRQGCEIIRLPQKPQPQAGDPPSSK